MQFLGVQKRVGLQWHASFERSLDEFRSQPASNHGLQKPDVSRGLPQVRVLKRRFPREMP
jgi:hypothetical protein